MSNELDYEAIAQKCLMDVSELLRTGWTNQGWCVNAERLPVHYTARSLTRFDLYGAVMVTTRSLKLEIVEKEKIEALLFSSLRSITGKSIVSFNAQCTKASDVIDAVLEAAHLFTPSPSRFIKI